MAVDLKDDPPGIAEYRRHHRRIWPEVRDSLRRVGVRRMDIYQIERRLVMVMDTRDGFDLRRSFAVHAASHPRCAEWEELMKTFQQAPPGAAPGRLWTPMVPIFHLERGPRSSRKARRRRSR
ncbi:MAG: L-fucose mutarotase [Acidobacteria bacterium]|nr:MAG: L-fucose mutarotase [Acidobacteriota bacterium]